MAHVEIGDESNNKRNDPVDPSSSRSSCHARRARPILTHLCDNLTQIKESATTGEDWSETAMEDQECLGEYDPSSSETAETTCPVESDDDVGGDQVVEERNSHDNSPVSQQNDLVSTGPTDGEYVSRQKNKINKMKLLVRSHALREAASPPPDSPSASSPLFGASNDSSAEQQQQQQQHRHHHHHQQQHQHHHQTPLVITLVESDDEVPPHQQETTSHVTHRLRPRVQVESSQCSVDSTSSFVSFSLSRDSSSELANGSDCYLTVDNHSYTDNTGVDLQHFIEETLHRNYKDRMTLLRIEQDMIALVRDTKRTCHRFPAMSSYHRMLVHRVAAYFGMEHNVDQSGNCVVVSKSRHTRLPEVAFKEYVRDDVVLPEEPSRKLNPNKRETVSFDEPHSPAGRFGRSPEARSRSLDVERDADINRPRNRALQPQVTWVSSPEGAMGARSKENLSENYLPAAPSRHTGEEIQNLRWPKRFNQGTLRHHRIPKVESFDSRDLLASYGNGLRPTVAKSYSFGGYTAASDGEISSMRGENVINGAPTMYQPHVVNQGQNYSSRFLSKQDSNSSSISISRSSPTSSGYKSQQSAATSPIPVNRLPLRGHVATTSCTNNCSNESQNGFQEWTPSRGPVANVSTCANTTGAAAAEIVSTTPANTSLLWAVTSLDAVPPGSILINPQTGQPFYNADGSAYRYDPQLPLPFQVEGNGTVNNETTGEMEQAEPYETYERQEVIVKAEESNGASVTTAPLYPTWQQHSYESPLSPVMASPYANPAQPYFGPEFASFHTANAAVPTSHHAPNGFFVSPSTVSSASFDDHMKANCVAVPVAHGNGYVLYQACLGPPADNGASIDSELYSAMKNLSLRPINGVPPVSYPSVLADGLAHPTEMGSTASYMTAVPIRPVITNPKMTTTLTGSLPSRSGSTPPATVSCAPTATLASNPYLTSIRVQSNGQMVHHHQVQPYNGATNLTTPYHPSMMYPLMNPGSHQQVNRPHYFPSSLVHQLNNAQFVSSPWSLVTTSPATARGTPERDNAVNVDVPINRMVAAPHSPNRLSCLYGPSLPSPFLTGDCGGIRHSSTVIHRQFSLPSSGSQAMYTLRPRIHQQPQQLPTAMPGSSSSMPRPIMSSIQNHPGALAFSSRHARTRRQVFRPHYSGVGFTAVTDPSSVMTVQNCPFPSVQQHFPSSTS